MPTLARMVIEACAKPGQLVLDPMCGIGTTLVEAVHAGRDAVGVEYEPRWSSLLRDNLDRSVDHGATGHGAARTGDARDTAARLGGDVAGRVQLLLTSLSTIAATSNPRSAYQQAQPSSPGRGFAK
jgi:adenine-specific DNA methylase